MATSIKQSSQDAHEAFIQLTPRLMDIADAISRLPVRERHHLANMVAGYFFAVSVETTHADLRVVGA